MHEPHLKRLYSGHSKTRPDSGIKVSPVPVTLDEEIIFISEAVQRKVSSVLPSFRRTTHGTASGITRQNTVISNKSSQKDKMKSSSRKRQAPMKTTSPLLQTSLNDFFLKSHPKLDSDDSADRKNIKRPRTSSMVARPSVIPIAVSENNLTARNQVQSPDRESPLNHSMDLFKSSPDNSVILHNLAVEEAIRFIGSDDMPEPDYLDGENDSSSDDWMLDIPDDALLDKNVPTSPKSFVTPVVIPKKIPILTGEFRNSSGRQCPFYKILPGTGFSVDAFNFGYVPNVKSYFLSHFHSDHYIGMTAKFQQPIYCSRITANLVRRKIRVDDYWVKEIPMNTPHVVDGVELTLLDANHCPGSCLFLFKLKDGRVYLHTGDFRADPSVLSHNPLLSNLREVSKLYLDTTYLDPYYEFESQAATVEFAATYARQVVDRNPKTLIVCGTYSVGKEKVFMRIAEILQSKVAVTSSKKQLLDCFEWSDFDAMLTTNWNIAQVHVLHMQAINAANLTDHLNKYPNFSSLLAIVPSGWQFNKKATSLRDIKPKVTGAVSILGLPYSEHSSYRELEWFVRFIKPKQVIPTVNVGNPKRRSEMERIINSWLDPSYKPTVVKKQNLITGFLRH